MDLRRALLLLAVTLLFVAVASSLMRPVPESDEPPAVTTPSAPEGSSGSSAAGPPQRIRIAGGSDPPERETIEREARAILTVTATESGVVQIEGLDRLAPAEPGTPAVFDLVADRPGRFEIVFMPTDGLDRHAGTLIVRGSR